MSVIEAAGAFTNIVSISVKTTGIVFGAIQGLDTVLNGQVDTICVEYL